MSAVDFQLVNDERIDDSIIERDFMKINHQFGADVNNQNSNINFYCGESQTFIQVGSGYLEFDIRSRRANNSNFGDADVVRIINNAFAYTIHDARISIHQELKSNKTSLLGLYLL